MTNGRSWKPIHLPALIFSPVCIWISLLYLSFPRSHRSSLRLSLSLTPPSASLSSSLALSVALILSSSRGLAIFKFITILVAVLLTSAAKNVSSPLLLLVLLPAPFHLPLLSLLRCLRFKLFIYLFIYSFFFFTFNDFFHSAELRECFFFFFHTTNYQLPIGVRRHYLSN